MAAGAVAVEVPTLVGLGLPEPAARLWATMHTAPAAGVEDLAGMLGMTESEVRAGLDELADQALVRVSRQRPGRLVPIAAEAAVQVLLRAQEAALEAHRRALEQQRDAIARTLTDALPPDGGPEPSGQVEHLTDPDAVQARFE